MSQAGRLTALAQAVAADVKSITNYSALANFTAAFAKRESRRCNIIWAGASLAEGFPVLDYDKTPPKQLQTILRNKFGINGGRGFVSVPTIGTTPPLVTPVTISGGAVDPATVGAAEAFSLGANHNCWYTNGTGSISYKASDRATRVDVYVLKAPSGATDAGQYLINGAGAVTFSTYDPSGVIGVVQITVKPGDTVTVQRNGLGAAGYVILLGFQEHGGDETIGLQVANVGHCGYTCSQWNVGSAVVGGWLDMWAKLGADLVILSDTGANDGNTAGSGKTAAQYKADLQTWIASIKSGLPGVPILIVSPYNTSGGIVYAENWPNYAQAAQDVVKADATLAYLDLGKYMPITTGNPKGLYSTDLVHGGTDGAAYELMAELVAMMISPQDPGRDAFQSSGTVTAASIADQTGFAADTSVIGSARAIPKGRLKPGSFYRCKMHISKTAAGLATPIVQVRLGTTGTAADASLATLTFAAQTAVADDGFLEVFVSFRSLGPGTQAVIKAVGVLDHALAATGFSTANTSIKSVLSAGFDSTTPTFISISVNGGASAAWTMDLVQAELQN